MALGLNTSPMSPAEVIVAAMQPEDWPAVHEIHEEGIATGDATFETHAPAWEDWDRGHLSSCRLVARAAGEVVGWAALSPVQRKSAYRGVAEVSVYVAERMRASGVGRALAEATVEAAEREGIWTLECWIFPENRASLALCEALGFRVVGVRERIGRLHGSWRDVVIVERRSPTVGS
jgi:L-amino acid N-acyltransferase YncA